MQSIVSEERDAEYLIAKQTVETILNIDRKKEQEKKTVR